MKYLRVNRGCFFMQKNDIHLFIDFEFTMPEKGEKFNGFYPEIIEVGAVLVKNDQILKQFSSYVKPIKFPILSRRCKNFLSIKQEDINEGLEFETFIQHLKELCEEQPTKIITWGNMDMKVLRQNCQELGIEFPFQAQEIDLSIEYKQFFGDRNQTGLWKAVQAYGKEGSGKHHRALDDALTTFNIYRLVEKDKKYLQRPKPTTIGERIDLTKLRNILV